jgi:hypothetical protein
LIDRGWRARSTKCRRLISEHIYRPLYRRIEFCPARNARVFNNPSAFRSNSFFATKDMPSGLKGLRKTVSRIGKSIKRSNDGELPGSSAETPEGDSMARTNHSASTESIHTVALTSAASDSQLGDSIPRSFPSTNDPSARSDAPSGASKIKANRVHVSVHFMVE